LSQHWALIWTVKPGTEQQVEEIFANYTSPDRTIRDEQGVEVGKLLATQVFMKDNIVVRVMEIEGDLRQAAVHLGKQPQIRELEAKLDPLIATPRDMSTPEGARQFFMSTAMRCLVARKLEDV
jgi:SchA/CurD like domain-containing protein